MPRTKHLVLTACGTALVLGALVISILSQPQVPQESLTASVSFGYTPVDYIVEADVEKETASTREVLISKVRSALMEEMVHDEREVSATDQLVSPGTPDEQVGGDVAPVDQPNEAVVPTIPEVLTPEPGV